MHPPTSISKTNPHTSPQISHSIPFFYFGKVFNYFFIQLGGGNEYGEWGNFYGDEWTNIKKGIKFLITFFFLINEAFSPLTLSHSHHQCRMSKLILLQYMKRMRYNRGVVGVMTNWLTDWRQGARIKIFPHLREHKQKKKKCKINFYLNLIKFIPLIKYSKQREFFFMHYIFLWCPVSCPGASSFFWINYSCLNEKLMEL